MKHRRPVPRIGVDKKQLENVLKKIDPLQGVLKIDAHVKGVVQPVGQFDADQLGAAAGIIQKASDVLVIGFLFEARQGEKVGGQQAFVLRRLTAKSR